MKSAHKTISKLRPAVAAALMFWCAGAGCIMMSYLRDAAMSAAEAGISNKSAGWDRASGSGGTHHCGTAQHAAASTSRTSSPDSADLEELAEAPNTSDAISCCPLASGTFVVSSRQSLSNECVLASQGAGVRPDVTYAAMDSGSMPVRHPDQNQTYLRGCVFLI